MCVCSEGSTVRRELREKGVLILLVLRWLWESGYHVHVSIAVMEVRIGKADFGSEPGTPLHTPLTQFLGKTWKLDPEMGAVVRMARTGRGAQTLP